MTAIITTCARIADVLTAHRATPQRVDGPAQIALSRAELTVLFASDLADQGHRLRGRRHAA